MELTFGEHDTGDVRLHFAEMGPKDAPLIFCLHGFPEYWTAWKAVMGELAGNFRLVAPDQRGFNLSSRPSAVEAYRGRHLVADFASLADHLSPDRPFVLAGHDWGASVAYAYAFRHAARLSHLVIANGVHPICFQRAIIEDPEQRQASQYMRLLCSERAEQLLAEDNYRRLMGMIEGFSTTSFMDNETRAAYVETWSRPGALSAMLNWYRASPILVPEPDIEAAMPPELARGDFSLPMPHLLLWGEADQALRPSTFPGLEEFAPDLTVRRFPNAGHWILHERPREVADAIRTFLRG
ncbi:MAG: alpha/beta fold hydrolase [Mesorhizobium sp.]|nr:alpha/beta fold hydrolase [Mesorhizobium sp.]